MHVRRRAAAPQAAHDGVTPTGSFRRRAGTRTEYKCHQGREDGRTDGRMAEWTETDGPGIWLESYAITYTRFISGIVSLCHANFIVNWTLYVQCTPYHYYHPQRPVQSIDIVCQSHTSLSIHQRESKKWCSRVSTPTRDEENLNLIEKQNLHRVASRLPASNERTNERTLHLRET